MNTIRISHIIAALFPLVLCCTSVGLADPLGTAFTYQGRLIDANQPADGLYDLQFKLYDSASGGSQTGSDVNTPDTQVTDGYFTVQLDFGSQFDGNARWLEIGVRPGVLNDPSPYTTIAPRQKVTPAPYALRAMSVSVPLVLTAAGAPGTAILSVGSTGDGVAIGASSSGGDIAVLGKNGAAVWGISPTGYAGYFDGKGYFSGNVGIGTTSPAAKLEVVGQIKIADGSQGTGKVLTSDSAGLATWQTPTAGGDITAVTAATGLTGGGTSGDVTLALAAIYVDGSVYDARFVNVTGDTMTGSLTVNDHVKIADGSQGVGKVLTSDAAGLATWQTPAVGDITAVTAGAGLSGGGTSGDVTLAVGVPLSLTGSVASTGTVIDATNTGTGYGVRGKHNTSGNYGYLGGSSYGIYGESFGGNGVYGKDNSTGNYGILANSNIGVYGEHYSSGNAGFLGSIDYGVYGECELNSSTSSGVYGVNYGTDGKGVYGKHFSSGNYGYLGGSSYGVWGYSASGVGVYGDGASMGIGGWSNGSTSSRGVSGNSPNGRGVYGESSFGKGVVGYGGTAGTSYDFDATGPGVNYGATSSIRWKRDIEVIDAPLEKIMQLRGVYFNWDAAHGGHHDIGMIAEEVGKVLPEIVVYEENGVDADGMDYSMTTPLLVEAVKALKTQVDDLRKENQDLHSRLDALENLAKGAK